MIAEAVSSPLLIVIAAIAIEAGVAFMCVLTVRSRRSLILLTIRKAVAGDTRKLLAMETITPLCSAHLEAELCLCRWEIEIMDMRSADSFQHEAAESLQAFHGHSALHRLLLWSLAVHPST